MKSAPVSKAVRWTWFLVLFFIAPWLHRSVADAQAPVYRGYFPQPPASRPAIQHANPYISRPPVSPYVNLARGRVSPGINYFGLIRPEFNFRNQLGSQQQYLQQLYGRQAQREGAAEASATGHETYFLNYADYYYMPGLSGQ